MKKLFLGLLVAAFTLSIYSCRETREENVEADFEEVENDLERTGEEVEAEFEQAGDEVEQEIDEEVYETDDMQ